MSFHKILINWYLANKRDLPWRNTRDPYQVWLSEIILQQTRVEQGFPYYLKFLKTYPTVFELANAPQAEILKMWQGLGYYSRARNLHETAQYVAFGLDGLFPNNFLELKKLKGIGDYTASAIASSCYKEPVAVVDGNVFRFLGRYFGIYTASNTGAGLKEFKAIAQEFLDSKNPDLYNQGLMEFGSKHCKPQQPLCQSCPFAEKCFAYAKNEVKNLPVKLKNIKIKKRYFNYIVFVSEKGETIIEQRTQKDIWQNMYQFPLVETEKPLATAEFLNLKKLKDLVGKENEVFLYNEVPVQHKLTHQQLFTQFWIVQTKKLPSEGVNFKDLKDFPVPVLIQNFIDAFQD